MVNLTPLSKENERNSVQEKVQQVITKDVITRVKGIGAKRRQMGPAEIGHLDQHV